MVESRLSAGRALAAAGRASDAVAMLQRAAADAGARPGAMLYHDAAARELRRLGSRLSAEDAARRRAARAGLTERERDIAGLVSAGRSNKEVAASLFLSEKTIEHHLSRIYAKLGVRSRVELAARLECGVRRGSGLELGVEQPGDARDRDADPVGAVVELVAQLVDGLLELEDGEQLVDRVLAGRQQRAVDALEVALEERRRAPASSQPSGAGAPRRMREPAAA